LSREYIPKSLKMPRRTWQHVKNIIRDYREMKAEYNECVSSILYASHSVCDVASFRKSNNTSDTTGDKVVRLTSPYMIELQRMTSAFEKIYANLGGEEKKFIQGHYWEGKLFRQCDCYMSERTMSDINKKIIFQIAYELNLIK